MLKSTESLIALVSTRSHIYHTLSCQYLLLKITKQGFLGSYPKKSLERIGNGLNSSKCFV